MLYLSLPSLLSLSLSLPPSPSHPTLSLSLQVRWADLEAAKEEQRKKEVGFCIGGGWSQLTAEEAETILRGRTNSIPTGKTK